MSPPTRDAKHHTKAKRRRYHTAQERLARDRRQAQRAAEALEQALQDLGLPDNVVAEIEGRIRSQQKLLGKIVGIMFPPLFGCRTNTELCRVRGWDKNLPLRLPGAGDHRHRGSLHRENPPGATLPAVGALPRDRQRWPSRDVGAGGGDQPADDGVPH